MRAHAQELSDEVCDAHIALYVNEFTLDLGDEGFAAIERLLGAVGAPRRRRRISTRRTRAFQMAQRRSSRQTALERAEKR